MSRDDIRVGRDTTIRDALQKLNSNGQQIVVVIDGDDRVLGTASDGDIRRGLLGGKGLEAPVLDIANLQPVTMQDSMADREILRALRARHLHQMVVVDDAGRLVALRSLDDLVDPPVKPNIVVLMVGGLGSRLGHLTSETPKPMLPVGGRPILEAIVDQFRDHGFRHFRFAVNYRADVIERHFGDGSAFDCEIRYLREQQRMGTAGALSLIDEHIEHPVLVANGDLLLQLDLQAFLDYHDSRLCDATMAVRSFDVQIPYGVIRMENDYVKSIDEKPVQSFLIAGGIYCLEPSCLKLVPTKRFYDMPTLLDDIVRSGGRVTTFGIDGYWLDVGQAADYERAQRDHTRVTR